MRPALISRSDSLCMASMSAGVGPRIGSRAVTIYMKRMAKLLFEASRGACGTVSLFRTTNETPADRQGFGENFAPAIRQIGRTGALGQRPADPISHRLPQ